MKNKFMLCLTGIIIILTVLAACRPPGTEVFTPPPQATPSSPAVSKQPAAIISEWDSLAERAKKEGSVVVHHAAFGEARDVSATVFREKYNVAVDYLTFQRSAEEIQRITSERNAGLYSVDVMIMGLGGFYNMLGPMKITVPLQPQLVLPEVTDGSKWRTGNISFVDAAKTAIAFSLSRLLYTAINTNMVKEGEMTSIEDVLAPKWKGSIVVNDPTVAGMSAEWFSFIILQAYGREKGQEYMRRLVKQEPLVIRDQRLEAEWVARGRCAIGLGIEPSEIDKLARAGAPIKLIAMVEGQPVTSGPMNLMIMDKAPHPNAAKLYINWILSQEGGTIMSKYSGYVSARVDVSVEGFDPALIPGPKDILPGEEYKLQQGELLKVAAEIFKDLLK